MIGDRTSQSGKELGVMTSSDKTNRNGGGLRPICAKPCAECPFRRASLPGYLGADNPAGFIATTMADYSMPCHSTIDYSDPQWKVKWDAGRIGRLCAGAAIFFANMCKLSRDRDRPTLPADRELVFAHPREFLAHHGEGEESGR
jgi:hypothetical protein